MATHTSAITGEGDVGESRFEMSLGYIWPCQKTIPGPLLPHTLCSVEPPFLVCFLRRAQRELLISSNIVVYTGRKQTARLRG